MGRLCVEAWLRARQNQNNGASSTTLVDDGPEDD